MYALAIFVIGTFTDLLDGFWARRFNQVTSIGKFLDPLADKLFFLFSLSIMSYKGLVPLWFFGILLLRDIFVSIGSVIFIDRVGMKNLSPHITGKAVNLCIFFITLFIIVDHTLHNVDLSYLYYPLYPVTILLSGISFFIYWDRFKKI